MLLIWFYYIDHWKISDLGGWLLTGKNPISSIIDQTTNVITGNQATQTIHNSGAFQPDQYDLIIDL